MRGSRQLRVLCICLILVVGTFPLLAVESNAQGRTMSINGVAVDGDDNIIVTGEVYDEGAGKWIIRTEKYDGYDGHLIWTKEFTEYDHNIGKDVAVDDNGNVIVVATVGSPGDLLPEMDYFLIKYSKNGDRMWDSPKTYNNGMSDVPWRVTVDKQTGNIFVTGVTIKLVDSESATSDFWTIKCSGSNGSILAEDVLDVNNNADMGIDIALTNTSESLVVVGSTQFDAPDYNAYCMQRYNTSLDPIGNPFFYHSENTNESASGVAIDSNNNIFVTGHSNGSAGQDFLTVKYNDNDVQVDDDLPDMGGKDDALAIAGDHNDNIIVTGFTTDNTGTHFYTMKYDNTLEKQWAVKEESFTGEAKAVAVDSQNNVIVAGCNTGQENQYYTIKYDPNGTFLWKGGGPTSKLKMATDIATIDSSGECGDDVLVPVRIVDIENGPVQTICFDIIYNHSLIELQGIKPGELTPIEGGWSHNLGSNHESITITTSNMAHAIPNGSTGSVAFLNFSVVGKLPLPGTIFTSNLTGISNQEMEIVNLSDSNITLRWLPNVGKTFTMPMYWGLTPVENPYWIWENASTVISYNETHASVKTTPNEMHNLTIPPFWENATEVVALNDTTVTLSFEPKVGDSFSYYGQTVTVENVTNDTINVSVTYGNQTQYTEMNKTLPWMHFNLTTYLNRTFSQIPQIYVASELNAQGYVLSNTTPLDISSLDISNVALEHGTASTQSGIFRLVHWAKGDLDHNGEMADAVDVTKMMQASVGDIPSDDEFDLDGNGEAADAVDVAMMLQASVGDINLSTFEPPSVVKASLSADKETYSFGETVLLQVTVEASDPMDNITIQGEGLVSSKGPQLTFGPRTLQLLPGTNIVNFSKRVPSCSPCTGLNPGRYNITASISQDGEILAEPSCIVELTNGG